MVSALRHRAFQKLASLYCLNSVLEWFSSVALMVLVFDATGNAFVATLMLVCKQVVPGLLLPFLSQPVERSGLRGALAASLAAQAVVLGALAVLGYGAWLFPLAALAGTFGALFRATLRAAVARSLAGPALRSGNALLNVLGCASATAGPACAAAVVALSGAETALYVGAIGASTLALLAATVPALPAAQIDAVDDPPVESPRSTTAASPLPISVLLAATGLIFALFSMDEPALLPLSEHALGAGVGGYGAMYAAWGLGLAAGSVIFSRLLGWPMLRVATMATVLVGAAYLGMGLAPGIVAACVVAVVGGAGNGMLWVSIVTGVQEATPRGREAHTAMRLEAIATAAPAVGVLIGGAITELVGPRVALALPGSVALATVLLGALVVRSRALAPAQTFSPTTSGGPA